MEKRKINTNRPDISSEEIKAGRDFNTLLSNYQAVNKPPFYKQKWFLTSAVVAIIAFTGTFVFTTMNDDEVPAAVETPFVNPPLEGVNVTFEHYTVEASDASELEYTTGTKLIIPEGAFVDSNGNPVTGPVEIRYREFHDPIDFLVSGIPMTYDSAGTQYHFESAGMIEMLAFQNGAPVFIAPDKEIQVEMASNQPGDYFNLYALDTNARNWDYRGKDRVVEGDTGSVSDTLSHDADLTSNKSERLEKNLDKVQQQIKELKAEAPIAPRKPNNDRFNMMIEVNKEEFPEIAEFKNVKFEIGEENKNFKPEMAQTVWDYVTLAKGASDEKYEVTFIKDRKQHTFVVYPVLEGKDYDKAKKAFEKHEKALAKKQEKEAEIAAELKEEYADLDAQWRRSLANAVLEETAEMEKSRRMVMRAFSINQMGIWNCDCPRNLPKGALIAARFVERDTLDLGLKYAYLVEKNKNAVYTYYNSAFSEFQYNPDAINMVLGITADNKLAVMTPKDFKKLENAEYVDAITDSNEVYHLPMSIRPQKVRSTVEIRKLIGS